MKGVPDDDPEKILFFISFLTLVGQEGYIAQKKTSEVCFCCPKFLNFLSFVICLDMSCIGVSVAKFWDVTIFNISNYGLEQEWNKRCHS